MSMEADLLQTERQGDEPPPAIAPPEEPPAQAAPPVDEDTAFEQQLAEQTIDLPEGEKLVPLSAVTTLREKLKDTKGALRTATEGSARAQQLEQQIAQMQQQLQSWAPYVQAYQAAVQQPQAQAPAAAPEDTAELEEIARDFDLYTADGKPDLTKAKRIQQREEKRASRIADTRVQSIEQREIQRASQQNLMRAKKTVINGMRPDPETLDTIWQRLDPALTADEAGAKQAIIAAMGYSVTMGKAVTTPAAGPQRGADGKFAPQTAADIPAPLYTEKAGGKDTPETLALSPEEQRFIKAAGMTDKEYLESARNMPGGRR